MTRVSIVTISFNQAEFLERTILSVLSQDYPEIEYIVVDPGSKDHSRDIIEKYRSRISKVIYRPDRGAADGLNNGFSEATGDVFGFLNSDDVLLDGAVSSAVRFLDKSREIDVVSAHSNLIGPRDEFFRRLYSDRMSINRALYGAAILIQPSTFFRKEIFTRVGGFTTDNRICWDSELFLKMALAQGKFALVNEIWSAYRVHQQSVTFSENVLERILQKQAEIFFQVTGRRQQRADKLLIYGHRILRKVLNPRDAWERALRGPVAGRTFDR
jgi:glycosyltransferase involved in cell wall biosynthesis